MHAWFFAPQPIHALVAARVVFGFALLSCYLVRLPDARALYWPTGLTGPETFQNLRAAPAAVEWLARVVEAWFPTISAGAMAGLYALLLLSALCFMLGFRTRLAGSLALAIHAYLVWGRDPFAYWGWGEHIQVLFLYLVLAPTGRVFSLDAWLAGRRGQPPAADAWLAPAWPLRLLQVHTCAMYATSGWVRITDPGWFGGEAVYLAMATPLHSRLIIDWQPFKPLLAAVTYGAFVMEPAASILLWVRRIGPWLAYALIAMHVMLEILTTVGWWNYIMIASLLCFVPIARLDAVLKRLPGGPGR